MALIDLIFPPFFNVFFVIGNFCFNHFNFIASVAPQNPDRGQHPVTPSAVIKGTMCYVVNKLALVIHRTETPGFRVSLLHLCFAVYSKQETLDLIVSSYNQSR